MPDSRLGSKVGRPTRRRRARRALPWAIALAVVTIVVSVLVLSGRGSAGTAAKPPSKGEILALWERGDWPAVTAACDRIIARSPLDPFALGIKGMASFNLAMEKPEGEERDALVDASIVAIRTTLATREAERSGRVPLAELEYILAKSYYHKGGALMDLSVTYMRDALRDGFQAPDAHEYLAMGLSALGEPAASIVEFEKALALDHSDLLKIAAAREYLKAGRLETARDLLRTAASSPTDIVAREKARLMLAEADSGAGRLDEAEAQLTALLSENPDSADGHYRLGLIYQSRGDPVHARAEWRKAVALDPMHAAARQKLAERL